MNGMVSTKGSVSNATVPEEADVLRRFIEAIESGELMETTPQDEAVVERLQGALTALESNQSGARPRARSRR
jgi:hypothetical protein